MQEKILGELISARIHAGPVFALARIQENIFEEVFPEYCAKFLGEFIRCEYMPRLYSHPREYRKIFLVNYLCARGYRYPILKFSELIGCHLRGTWIFFESREMYRKFWDGWMQKESVPEKLVLFVRSCLQ